MMQYTYLEAMDFLYIPWGDSLHSYTQTMTDKIKFQYEQDTDLLCGVYLYGVSVFDADSLRGLLSPEQEEQVRKILTHFRKEE